MPTVYVPSTFAQLVLMACLRYIWFEITTKIRTYVPEWLGMDIVPISWTVRLVQHTHYH